jgi:hypothetical protein
VWVAGEGKERKEERTKERMRLDGAREVWTDLVLPTSLVPTNPRLITKSLMITVRHEIPCRSVQSVVRLTV